jgi:hypothetical protein
MFSKLVSSLDDHDLLESVLLELVETALTDETDYNTSYYAPKFLYAPDGAESIVAPDAFEVESWEVNGSPVGSYRVHVTAGAEGLLQYEVRGSRERVVAPSRAEVRLDAHVGLAGSTGESSVYVVPIEKLH